MAWQEGVLFCDGCGAEITDVPAKHGDQLYCCQDCADERICDCGLILDDDRRTSAGSELAA